MRYVALLRGINVGGKNKVDMKSLVSAMEHASFEAVSTYINSGNIFFTSSKLPKSLQEELRRVIQNEFGLDIPVLVMDKPSIEKIVKSIPDSWSNGSEMKCDVMFLWEEYDDASVLEKIKVNRVDTVQYVDGAIIWKAARQDLNKSGMKQIIGTDLYANMTVRNCNTARAILERL